MDTAIAILVIVIAAFFVFRKVRNQISAKGASGCGCSGGCSSGSQIDSGSCCQGGGDDCSCDK